MLKIKKQKRQKVRSNVETVLALRGREKPEINEAQKKEWAVYITENFPLALYLVRTHEVNIKTNWFKKILYVLHCLKIF